MLRSARAEVDPACPLGRVVASRARSSALCQMIRKRIGVKPRGVAHDC